LLKSSGCAHIEKTLDLLRSNSCCSIPLSPARIGISSWKSAPHEPRRHHRGWRKPTDPARSGCPIPAKRVRCVPDAFTERASCAPVGFTGQEWGFSLRCPPHSPNPLRRSIRIPVNYVDRFAVTYAIDHVYRMGYTFVCLWRGGDRISPLVRAIARQATLLPPPTTPPESTLPHSFVSTEIYTT